VGDLHGQDVSRSDADVARIFFLRVGIFWGGGLGRG